MPKLIPWLAWIDKPSQAFIKYTSGDITEIAHVKNTSPLHRVGEELFRVLPR